MASLDVEQLPSYLTRQYDYARGFRGIGEAVLKSRESAQRDQALELDRQRAAAQFQMFQQAEARRLAEDALQQKERQAKIDAIAKHQLDQENWKADYKDHYDAYGDHSKAFLYASLNNPGALGANIPVSLGKTDKASVPVTSQLQNFGDGVQAITTSKGGVHIVPKTATPEIKTMTDPIGKEVRVMVDPQGKYHILPDAADTTPKPIEITTKDGQVIQAIQTGKNNPQLLADSPEAVAEQARAKTIREGIDKLKQEKLEQEKELAGGSKVRGGTIPGLIIDPDTPGGKYLSRKEKIKSLDAQIKVLEDQLPKRGKTETAKDSGRVSVMSPDGKAGTLPADQLDEALKQGYKVK